MLVLGLRIGIVARLEFRAGAIRDPTARQRLLDDLLARSDHSHVHGTERDLVAGLDYGVLGFGVKSGVRRLEILDLLAFFRRWPMIDVMLDWDTLREFLKAADVVHVVMRDDQVIDLLDARRV